MTLRRTWVATIRAPAVVARNSRNVTVLMPKCVMVVSHEIEYMRFSIYDHA